MRKLLIGIIASVLLFVPTYADIEPEVLDAMTLEELKELEKDVSDRIAKLEKEESPQMSVWEIRHYVDEFKRETDEGYVSTINPIQGTFSNSATTNSKLYVYPLFEENFRFKLIEYGSNVVKGYHRDGTRYGVYILDESDEKTRVDGILYNGSEALSIKDTDTFSDLLNNNDTLTILIIDSEYQSTKYIFELTDLDQYRDLWKTLSE